MPRGKKSVPKFVTEEAEVAFWDKHSPLEFHEEAEFKPLETRAPKDRPITVRLDTRLRKLLEEFASAHHLGPSTAVRSILEQALTHFERQRQAGVSLEEAQTKLWEQMPVQHREELENLIRQAVVGDPENLPFILLNTRQAEVMFRRFFLYLLAALGATIIEPGDEEYEALKARAHS